MTSKTSDSDTRDRPFNAGRLARTAEAQDVIRAVIEQLQEYERRNAIRQRKRRVIDQQAFEATVTALIADAMHRDLTAPGEWIAVTMSKRKLGGKHRARAIAFNKTLPTIVRMLASAEMQCLEMVKGKRHYFGGKQTTVRCGAQLRLRIDEAEITLSDLRLNPSVLPGPIKLRARKLPGQDRGAPLPLPVTDEVAHMSAQVDQLNRWFSDADITADERDSKDRVIDAGHRHVRRIFNNGSMKEGGRLYGGFWQSLPKEDRLSRMRIGGEPLVALDFGQTSVRIAYGLQSRQAPSGDLYVVRGFEGCRDGIKAVLNALLASDKVLERFPAGSKKHFTKKTKLIDVVDAITSAHFAIAPLFGSAACFGFHYIESQVIVATLLDLKSQGIVALPVHDCLVVRASDVHAAKASMLHHFHDLAGVVGEVSIDAADMKKAA